MNDMTLKKVSYSENWNYVVTIFFFAVYKALMAFTNTELSAFYFDLSKDTLYNDSIDSSNRLSTQTALYHVSNGFFPEDDLKHLKYRQCLRVYSQAFAPLVPHLAEEVHQQFKKISNSLVESVFEQRWISAEVNNIKTKINAYSFDNT